MKKNTGAIVGLLFGVSALSIAIWIAIIVSVIVIIYMIVKSIRKERFQNIKSILGLDNNDENKCQ